MKYIASVCLFLLYCPAAMAQTYYYERIYIIEDGVKSPASGDGHFITFTSKGCYDSDVIGNTEDFGFREYKSSSGNVLRYYGDSYFGNAYYDFSTDRNRLNICFDNNNTIYVYIRRTTPAGVTRSSRKKAMLPVPTPVLPMQGETLSNSETNATSSSSSRSSSQQSRYGYYTCPTCHGSKKCTVCGGDKLAQGAYTSNNSYICRSCTEGKCSTCNGSGQKYGVIR